MLAVAWTNFFQILIVLVGLIIILPLYISLAGGWSKVVMATSKNFFAILPAKSSELASPDLGGWLWWIRAILGVIPVYLAFVAMALISKGVLDGAVIAVVFLYFCGGYSFLGPFINYNVSRLSKVAYIHLLNT